MTPTAFVAAAEHAVEMCGESSYWGSCDESPLLKKCSCCSHIMLNKVSLAKDKTPTEVSERNVLFWGLSGKVFF